MTRVMRRHSLRPPEGRKKRRWGKRLRNLAAALVLIPLIAGLYAYLNFRDVVVWFANRGHPELVVSVRHAALHWHRMEFSDVVLKLRHNKEEVVRIDSAVINFSWRGLREHKIGAVTVKQPRVRITDRLFAAVRNDSPARTLGSTESRPTNQANAKTWHVDKFVVTEGWGEIDLATAPLIRFWFAPEFHDLDLSPGPTAAMPQRTITLDDIEFLSRGEKPHQIGKIDRLELKFSQLEVGKMNFDELIIRAPSLQMTPAAVQALGAFASNPTNEASASFPNLRIGKLLIENGEVFIKDFGETVPEGSLKFGFETEDFQLGETGTALEKKHTVQFWDLRLAPTFAPLAQFATVDSLQVEFTPAGLLQRHEIDAATLTGITVTMGQTFRSFMNAGGTTTISGATPAAATVPTKTPPAKPWKLRELALVNSRVTLTDLGVGAPSVAFNIETTLKNIPLSAGLTETDEEIHTQEIADLVITSPLDQFAPVFTMKTLFIRYSIAGLFRHELVEIQVLNPTIYVGEDLFWYFDELSKREAETETAAANPTGPDETGWKVKKVSVDYGQLVIAVEGKARLPLPLQFSTSAENLNLGKLSDLKLVLDLNVPREDYLFPDYKLELRQLGGVIKFDLPPRSGSNNLVQTLHMSQVRWRQFHAEEGWLSITFDSKGVNGEIGAKGYGGYLNGGFSSFFGGNSPWVGWLSGTKVDLKKVTDVIAPGNFAMHGPADFKLEANGASSSLERLRGNLRATRGGKMQITKLDQVMADIPGDWYWVKRETTRILLETLRDFTYDTGDASFWYLNDEGNLKLTLRGPSGSRNIDLVLHGAEDRKP
ncbi:MAG: hypothetical protein DMF06_00325 [Verrucomicrobia bacterium]|nr:MAG: hypothetical protein DMF06_00325 [Verrucomicrobiota bacterium]